MKHKHVKTKLRGRQQEWDNLPIKAKAATTRPGSLNAKKNKGIDIDKVK